MKFKAIHILLLTLLFCVATESYGQSHNLPQPQMDSHDSGPGIPPPVGLPIDFGISALIAAGLGLGVFHLKNKKKD